MKQMILSFLRVLLILAGLSAGAVLAARILVELYAGPLIRTESETVDAKVAIVFGAGLTRDGKPTPVLRDRVETAAALYKDGKVQKLLMSGDNRFVYYNEPGAMRQYALELGVPDDAIVLDYAGRRTYDTCYRAKAIFGVHDAILVTQRFHLARALFTCEHLGIRASGVTADRRTYLPLTRLIWQIREFPASTVAIWDVFVTHPLPVLGDPEPIFPDPIIAQKP